MTKKLDEVLALLNDEVVCSKCNKYYDPTALKCPAAGISMDRCPHCYKEFQEYVQEMLNEVYV